LKAAADEKDKWDNTLKMMIAKGKESEEAEAALNDVRRKASEARARLMQGRTERSHAEGS